MLFYSVCKIQPKLELSRRLLNDNRREQWTPLWNSQTSVLELVFVALKLTEVGNIVEETKLETRICRRPFTNRVWHIKHFTGVDANPDIAAPKLILGITFGIGINVVSDICEDNYALSGRQHPPTFSSAFIFPVADRNINKGCR